MTALSLRLFGGFSARGPNGEEIAMPTRKSRGLLGYLAVNADQRQPRGRLAALLWSDRGERQARHSLNQALLSIRRMGAEAGVDLLDSDSEHVTLLGEAADVDVLTFGRLIDSEPSRAVELYEGPLLDGLAVRDPAFEDLSLIHI